MAKMTNHAIRNKIPKRWLYIDLLVEFAIRKGILTSG
jgi:hypothetical protein